MEHNPDKRSWVARWYNASRNQLEKPLVVGLLMQVPQMGDYGSIDRRDLLGGRRGDS